MLEFPLINSFCIAAASLSHSSAGRQAGRQAVSVAAATCWQPEQYETEAAGTWPFYSSGSSILYRTVLTPTANCINSIVALLSPPLLRLFPLLFYAVLGFSSFLYLSVFYSIFLPCYPTFCFFFRFTCLHYLSSSFHSVMFTPLTLLVSRCCFNAQGISYQIAQ